MSKISIGNVSGDNYIFGDNNFITNNLVANSSEPVLTRAEYFQIIHELRELERISLGHYLDDKYLKLVGKNPDFVRILYKDIFKVLNRVDREGPRDLYIEHGDFVVECGDIKLSGYPTNLDFALVWLHVKLVEEFKQTDPIRWTSKMEKFVNDFLNSDYDTPSYTRKLSALSKEISKERKQQGKSGLTWSDLNEFFELKPNFAGLGINFNEIFKRVIDRNKNL
jgi:hypothetical protein